MADYQDARTEMIRVGQLRIGDQHCVQRELIDIKAKLQGTALLGWLIRQDLRGVSMIVDDRTEEGHGYSLFGRIRQYIHAEMAEKGLAQTR